MSTESNIQNKQHIEQLKSISAILKEYENKLAQLLAKAAQLQGELIEETPGEGKDTKGVNDKIQDGKKAVGELGEAITDEQKAINEAPKDIEETTKKQQKTTRNNTKNKFNDLKNKLEQIKVTLRNIALMDEQESKIIKKDLPILNEIRNNIDKKINDTPENDVKDLNDPRIKELLDMYVELKRELNKDTYAVRRGIRNIQRWNLQAEKDIGEIENHTNRRNYNQEIKGNLVTLNAKLAELRQILTQIDANELQLREDINKEVNIDRKLETEINKGIDQLKIPGNKRGEKKFVEVIERIDYDCKELLSYIERNYQSIQNIWNVVDPALNDIKQCLAIIEKIEAEQKA